MKWKKFTLTTTTEAVDLVSSMLDDVGIEGIEVEDNVPLTEKEACAHFYLIVNAEASNQASALFDWVESHSKTGNS